MRRASPFDLAVFRIAVCTILLLTNEWRDAAYWSTFPAALRVPPEGLGWVSHALPIAAWLARPLQIVFVAATSLGFVGLFTRAAMTVATLSALYLFALPQLGGSVQHDMHLLWFAGLLAASPSGDALSADAWLARRRGKALPSSSSTAYAWPLASARVLLGLVYLFPGIWKIASSGWAWIATDNLRNQMYWKWYEHGWIPRVRIDGSPALCHALALATIAFELTFLPLALTRRTRPVAAVLGVGFHLGTQALMRIGFFSLWGCYVILFDWGWLAEDEPQGTRRVGRAWPLGVALPIVVAIQGARGAVQAWPFACYPTFQWTVGAEIPDVVLEAELPDGRRVPLPRPAKSQAAWAVAWNVAGERVGPPTDDAMRAYLAWAARDPRIAALTKEARAIHFSCGWFSVLPADWGAPPRRQVPLGVITIAP